MPTEKDRYAGTPAATSSVLVAGVPVTAVGFADAVDLVVSQAPAPGAGSVRLVNAWSIVTANDDADYLQVLTGSGMNLPDGKPVANHVRRHDPHAEQVRGPSFFRAVIDRGRAQNVRHYFLGNHTETLQAMRATLERDYPGVQIEGMFAPPYLEDPQDLVNLCGPELAKIGADIVWVSLGTPKQDFVTAELTKSTGAWVIGVGAALDFVAGTTREAPRWVSRVGGEWLHRFATEPRRLWRRYAIGTFKYLWLVRTR